MDIFLNKIKIEYLLYMEVLVDEVMVVYIGWLGFK